MSLKRFQRRLIRVLTVLVLLSAVFCVGLYAYRTFLGYNYNSSLSGVDLAAGVKADENITNIALFGLDTREGDTQSHSDCMMIVTVDNTRGKIKLTSLMRDSLVNIDGYGENKLNAAYFLGGPSLAIRTINENFGTDITEYIAVNFEQLVEIIDALGGVEINVQTTAELEELNRVIRDYGVEQGQSFQGVESTGLQTLDGVQALCYGRIRKGGTGDDWARVERQSIVMEAMFSKVQSMSASELIGLMQKLMPYVTTSLSATEIAPLIVGALQNGMPEIEHTRVPLDGEWDYYGASSEYILYDVDVAADHIHEYIYNDVYPGETPSDTGSTGATDGDTSSTGANEPLGGIDFDEPPTGPMTTDDSASSSGSTEDPASLAEEGGWYDPDTGDYYDSDGDRYYLDESGTRVYYAE